MNEKHKYVEKSKNYARSFLRNQELLLSGVVSINQHLRRDLFCINIDDSYMPLFSNIK
jgi:hypothetical protein